MDNNNTGRRRFSLSELDRAAEAKGGAAKTLWQLVKFVAISSLVGILQLALVNLLFFALRDWRPPLPPALAGVFSAASVGAGNDNWGFVLPFFVSNLAANVYGYIQNKRTTFKSDAPGWCFGVYLALMAALILFSTWLQGVVANALISTGSPLLSGLAPTIAAMCAGTLQLLVLFPVEKFVLLKEKKP